MTKFMHGKSQIVRVAALLAMAMILLNPVSALAVDAVWNNTGGGDYETGGNWVGGVPAGGVGATADFGQLEIAGDPRVTLSTDLTLGHLIVGDTNPATGASWELGSDNPTLPTLTLDDPAPTISVSALTPSLFDDVYLSWNLAGTNGFTKNGAGILTIAGGTTVHTITGGIHVNEGTLRMEGLTPGQVITIADGATLAPITSLDNGTGHTIAVEPGDTANIFARGSVELGQFDVDGATLNIGLDDVAAAGSTISADGNWGLGTASAARINFSTVNGGTLRLRPNGGQFNTGNAFAQSHVDLDNIIMFTRTNTNGNTTNIGALSGSSTAFIEGGAQGGGTVANYVIGALNTDTEFAGTIENNPANLPTPPENVGGLNLIKVGTGTLTLSGSLTYQPQLNNTAATVATRRGGITQIQAGTLALTNSAHIPGGQAATVAGDIPATVDIQAAGTLDISGYTAGAYTTPALQQIIGAGTIVGNLTHADGQFRPGNTITGNNPLTQNVAGTLTVDGDLAWNGGSYEFDMSQDPNAGNDLLHVTGDVALTSGTVSPNFFAGIPAGGNYTVLTFDGALSGSPGNIAVDFPGRGADPVLQQSGNSLFFVPSAAGGSANVVWTGSTNSVWDVETTQNWSNTSNGGVADVYFDFDNATFNESAANKTVTLDATVAPTSMTVDNTSEYSITGTGTITGTTGLTKTGSGNLILQVNGTYTGPTSITDGSVDLGSTSSLGLGPLTLTNTTVIGVNDGADIRNSVLTVPEGTASTITIDGGLGAGNRTDIPNIEGSGTLTISTNVGEDPALEGVNGKWYVLRTTSQFTGTINFEAPTNLVGMLVRTTSANNGGSTFPNAVVNLTNTALNNQQGGSGTATFSFGELHGDALSSLGGFTGGSGGRNNHIIEIGNLGTDSDFAGGIFDPAGTNNQSETGTGAAITRLRKVGAGTLTLTGAKTYTGYTDIREGTLSIDTAYLSDVANVFMTSDSIFDLGFTGADTINALYIDGIAQATGTWGAAGSGATHVSDLFTGTGMLDVTTTFDADFNDDGVVNGRDFMAALRGFTGSEIAGVEKSFGAGGGGPLAAANVPEPTSLLLVVFGLAGLAGRRSRRA